MIKDSREPIKRLIKSKLWHRLQSLYSGIKTLNQKINNTFEIKIFCIFVKLYGDVWRVYKLNSAKLS